MIKNDNLIETTERFYRLLQQSKKQDTSTHSPFVDVETKITRLDDSELVEVQEGIELLPLWGDSQQGASGIMIRFTSNIPQKIYYQNVCFAIVISGKVKFGEKEEAKLLQAGDSWTQKVGSSLHIESCPTEETTLLYIHCDKSAEMK